MEIILGMNSLLTHQDADKVNSSPPVPEKTNDSSLTTLSEEEDTPSKG